MKEVNFSTVKHVFPTLLKKFYKNSMYLVKVKGITHTIDETGQKETALNTGIFPLS